MPRFLFPNAEELNSMIRPNQRIIRDMKRQYRGTESTIGQEGDLMDKYNRIYDSMVKIISTLGEVSNTLKLGTNAAKGNEAMGRYVSVVSNVNIELARLLLFISQEVPSLQIFSTSQIESLSGMNNQLVGVVQEIEQIGNALPPAVGNKFRMILTPLIREVATLQQKLEGINTPSGRGSLTTFGRDRRGTADRDEPTTTPARTPARGRVRTPAHTPASPEFYTPNMHTTAQMESSSEDERPIRTPRRSTRTRTQPDRYSGSGRVDMRLPTAVGGGHTQRRFL